MSINVTVTTEYGTVSTSLSLLLHYGRLAGELYDHVAEVMTRQNRHVRDYKDAAVSTLVEMVMKSKVHKNDPANYRFKNHITLDESLMMEIQDAAADYGYRWTY